MPNRENRCAMKHCRKDQYIQYYGAAVCEDHWDDTSRKELRSKLGLDEIHAAMEGNIERIVQKMDECRSPDGKRK